MRISVFYAPTQDRWIMRKTNGPPFYLHRGDNFSETNEEPTDEYIKARFGQDVEIERGYRVGGLFFEND